MLLVCRRRIPCTVLWWCGSLSVSGIRNQARQSGLALLRLQNCCSGFDECILDRTCLLRLKHWTRIDGPRHWLFPRLQHAFHGLSCRVVHLGVGGHERLVQVLTNVDCVWCPDVFYDRVQYIQGRQLPRWCNLECVSVVMQSLLTLQTVLINHLNDTARHKAATRVHIRRSSCLHSPRSSSG